MTPLPKLIIFDWDGTLFDSTAQIAHSLQFAAQQFQQPLTNKDAKSVIGLGLPEVMQRLFPQVPEHHDAILACYSAHYVQHSGDNTWFDGIEALLNRLKQQQLLLAVATGKSRKGLDRVMMQSNSSNRFDITRTASETRSKPHPQMLIEILNETGMNATQAVMIGDTTYDLEMAQRIGMPRIGVSYGVHSHAQLSEYAPLTIVNDVQELTNFLTDWLGI